MPTTSENRGRKFTLRALLVLVTVICAVLALWYPRARYAVTVKLPGESQSGSSLRPRANVPEFFIDAATFQQLMGKSAIVERVTNKPAAAAYLKDVPDAGPFLKSLIHVTNVDAETLRFEATGRPTERRKLRIIVDAVADSIVEHHAESRANVGVEIRALIEKAAHEMDAEIAKSRDAGGEQHERSIKLRKAVQDRLDEISTIEDAGDPAEVLDRESGLDF